MKESARMPRYESTRGSAPRVDFASALRKGLAPDGGLYVPDQIPLLGESAWRAADSFPEMAFEVLAPWLGKSVPAGALRAALTDALDFPVPLIQLEGGEWEKVHVLELFHGPTLSFKDFGARVMARLLSEILGGEQLTILVATSGDTGSAVADGFAGRYNLRVVLLYPYGQVSPTQERQLIVQRPGVQAYAVRGTFDDCQRMVKRALQAKDLKKHLSAANSINVGRLLPQMLYWIWAVVSGDFRNALFCVPSGNLGNLTAGLLAALAGLPVRRFVAAHNANDGFPRFLAGEQSPFRDSVRTMSNAMDVGRPSNIERIRALVEPDRMREWIVARSVSDDVTHASMRRVHEATGYVADPHTAVGLEAVRQYRRTTGDTGCAVVLATAHPAKFPEVVRRSIGFAPKAPRRLATVWERPTRSSFLGTSDQDLQAVL